MMSGKGWTDQELFRHWLKDHFICYAVPGHPLLLILDGHSSHHEPISIEMAGEEGIILFCLPPHSTQNSQPLNCTVFGPLKRHYLSEAWLRALTLANIVAGFHKCGIHPFNRNAIPVPETSTATWTSVIRWRNRNTILNFSFHLNIPLCLRKGMRRGMTSSMSKITLLGYV